MIASMHFHPRIHPICHLVRLNLFNKTYMYILMVNLRRCLYISFHIPPIEGGARFKIAPPPRSPYIQSPAAARFNTAPPPKLSSYIQLPGAAPAIKNTLSEWFIRNQRLLPQKLAEKSSHQKLNSFILLFHCSIRIYIKIAC